MCVLRIDFCPSSEAFPRAELQFRQFATNTRRARRDARRVPGTAFAWYAGIVIGLPVRRPVAVAVVRGERRHIVRTVA
jgi:hypothetical protein